MSKIQEINILYQLIMDRPPVFSFLGTWPLQGTVTGTQIGQPQSKLIGAHLFFEYRAYPIHHTSSERI